MRRNKVIGTVLGVKHTADKECNEHIFHVHMTEAMIHDNDLEPRKSSLGSRSVED